MSLSDQSGSNVEILVHASASSRRVDDDHYRALAQAYLSFESISRVDLVQNPESLAPSLGARTDRQQARDVYSIDKERSDDSYHTSQDSINPPRKKRYYTRSHRKAFQEQKSFRGKLSSVHSPSHRPTDDQPCVRRIVYESITNVSPSYSLEEPRPAEDGATTDLSAPTTTLEDHAQHAHQDSTQLHSCSSLPLAPNGEGFSSGQLRHVSQSTASPEPLSMTTLSPGFQQPSQNSVGGFQGRKPENDSLASSPESNSSRDTPLQLNCRVDQLMTRLASPQMQVTSSTDSLFKPQPGQQCDDDLADLVNNTTETQHAQSACLIKLRSRPHSCHAASTSLDALSSTPANIKNKRPRLHANLVDLDVEVDGKSVQPNISPGQGQITPIAIAKNVELEIHPPSPEASVADLPQSFVTQALHQIAESLDLGRRFRPRIQTRHLHPHERGYWSVDCSAWNPELKQESWSFLSAYVGRGRAGWGVWAQRNLEGNALRIYCWGELVGHIYLLLYLVSQRKIKSTDPRWIDAEGKTVIAMSTD